MKIGILTFHSQLNYGGVLQCWALQIALESLGYDVVVLNRWMDRDNVELGRGYDKFNFWQWGKFLVKGICGFGEFAKLSRIVKTKRFLEGKLKLSRYHFYDWEDAPKELGVDLVVVGSDQVWHCGDWGDPRPYLMFGAPTVPVIAYAASLGMTEFPKTLYFKDGKSVDTESMYKFGLRRFNAISCRENEGVSFCQQLGFRAEHVVDPTLLAWLGKIRIENKRRCLVCYLLVEDIDANWQLFDAFASRNDCIVQIFTNISNICTPKTIMGMLRRIRRRFTSNVYLMISSGPDEFMHSIQSAKWVISDSFHALMFSIIYGCNVRILYPLVKNGGRKCMFGRIAEFANHMQGNLVVHSVVEALESFDLGEEVICDYDWLMKWRDFSLLWLKEHIRKIEMGLECHK